MIADPLVRLPDRIVGQMGVALGRRDLGVPEELPDLLERETETDAEAGEAVPQVVDSDILEPRFLAETDPGAFQLRQRAACDPSRKRVRIVLVVLEPASTWSAGLLR